MKKIQQLQQAYIAKPFTLDYISPSTINSFLGNKMGFVGRLLNFERVNNINFAKGNCVERAVNLFFHSETHAGNPESCIDVSLMSFDREAMDFDKYAEVRETLPATCMKAINRYVDYNEKPTIQKTVEGEINGITFKGILDFDFNSIISDCKVTGRTPSEMSQAHKNAAWIYHKLTGKDVVYDYFVPLKKEVKHVAFEFQPDDLTEELVMQAALAIQNIMNELSSNPNYIKQLCALFLSDPEQGYGDCTEIEYYIR
jgi:hypothetical protein